MLIVVHHRDLHALFQRLFDDEAFGGLDVLQIDAAEARFEQRNRVYERLRVLGIDFEVDRIDVGKALEEHRLALHHRLRRKRTEIAKPENRGAI